MKNDSKKTNHQNIENQFGTLMLAQHIRSGIQPLHERSFSQSTKEMMKLLAQRNKRYDIEKIRKANTEIWLINKGVDMHSMKDSIKEHHQIQIEQLKKENQQENCVFFMKPLNTDNQTEYMKKNSEFGIWSTVQSLMSSQKVKGSFVQRHLQRKKDNSFEFKFSNSARNQQKTNAYIQLTLYGLQRNLSVLSTVEMYFSNIKNTPFLQILYHQIKSVQNEDPQKALIKFSQASLKIIQKEFDEELPRRFQDILAYITNNFLCRVEGRYLRNPSVGPIWAVAFFLFRAGRRKQFLQVISFNREIHSIFISYFNDPLKIQEKINANVLNKEKDIFLEQLLYIVKGEILYSDEALCDLQKRDIVWFILKTAGMSRNLNQFNNFKEGLNQRYKEKFLSLEKAKNLFYVAAYRQLMEYGSNDFMNFDDIVHFLILITKCPFMTGSNDYCLKKMCSQKLVSLIEQLILKKRKEYINYMLLFPQELSPSCISDIIYNSQLASMINWKFLKQKLSPAVFQKTIKELISKLGANSLKNIEQVITLSTLIDNNSEEYLIEYFISTLVMFDFEDKMNFEVINRIQKIASGIFDKNQFFKNKYSTVFAILYQSRTLKHLRKKKNSDNIMNCLQSSTIIVLESDIPHRLWQALSILQNHRGFSVYIQYLKNFAQSYKLINYFFNEQHLKVVEICKMIFHSTQKILNFEPFSKYRVSPTVIETMTFLAEESGLIYP